MNNIFLHLQVNSENSEKSEKSFPLKNSVVITVTVIMMFRNMSVDAQY